jgi:hypothetical protein
VNDVGSDCCGTIVGDWQGLTAGGGRREDQGAATLKGLPRGGWPERTIPESIWVRRETNSGGYGCGGVGGIKQNYRLREFVACVC